MSEDDPLTASGALQRAMQDAMQTLKKGQIAPLLEPVLSAPPIIPPSPGRAIVDASEFSMRAASKAVQLLKRVITEFEGKIDPTSAVSLWLVGGPANQAFIPHRISAVDPDKILFEGVTGTKHPFVIIQHVSQLNFTLMQSPLEKDEKRHPIGFEIPKLG